MKNKQYDKEQPLRRFNKKVDGPTVMEWYTQKGRFFLCTYFSSKNSKKFVYTEKNVHKFVDIDYYY